MNKIMIALVGGQPLPNLLPIRHYRPDCTLLAYTSTTQSVFERLQGTLAPMQTQGIEVDAYRIDKTIEKLRGKVQKWEPKQLIFNLTGGTKAMAFAAYCLAADLNARFLYLESEGRKSRAYHYSFKDGIIHPDTSELLSPCVSIEDFLNVYLGKNTWQEKGYSRDEGGAFEEAIGTALQTEFEVKAGVKSHDGQLDIDLIVGLDNQFGIIEAKAGGKGGKLDGVKQLSTNGRLLGTYTRQFYVIDQPPNKTHRTLIEATQIKILSLTSYRTLGKLSNEDQHMLIQKVRRELVG
jgi:hypothetical protein